MHDLATTLESRRRNGAEWDLLIDRGGKCLLVGLAICFQHVFWAPKVKIVDDGDLLRLHIERAVLVFGSERHMTPVQTGKLLVVVEMVLRLDRGLQPLRRVASVLPLDSHDTFDGAAAVRNECLD